MTTPDNAARPSSDEEALANARLAVIGKIAEKHPRFEHIDDHEHPSLIGRTRTNEGVFLPWTAWGVSGDLDEEAYEAAHAAIAAHSLNTSKLHVYSRYNLFYTDGVIWTQTIGGVENAAAHENITAIDRHFTDDPDNWTVRKNPRADRSWFVVAAHGHIVEHATTKREALAEARCGFQRRLWHETRAWYLEQPGARDDGSRALTAHERARVLHILQTREQTR